MVDTRQYAIIVMSCDSYSDIWTPFSESIDKFWPDCPFDIFLCSEEKSFDHPLIKNLKTGKKLPWGAMLYDILGQLSHRYVIYLQEDYILKGRVHNEEILKLLNFCEKENAAYLRFLPFPPPDKLINQKLNVGIITKGSNYRTSLQAAVWDREVFLLLLVADENGWEFEKNSVGRSGKIDRPFYSVAINSDMPNKNHHRYPLDYYSTAVLQGKWQKEGVKILRQAGIKIDTSKRGVLTRWDFYYYHKKKAANYQNLPLLSWLDRNVFNRGRSKRLY